MQEHTLAGLISETRGRDEQTDLEARDRWVRSVFSDSLIEEYERVEAISKERKDRIVAATIDNDDWLSRVLARVGVSDFTRNSEASIYFSVPEFRMTPDQFCEYMVKRLGLKHVTKTRNWTTSRLVTGKTYFPEFILTRGDTLDFDLSGTSPTNNIYYIKNAVKELRPLRKDDPVSVRWVEWALGCEFAFKLTLSQSGNETSGKLFYGISDCAFLYQTGKTKAEL